MHYVLLPGAMDCALSGVIATSSSPNPGPLEEHASYGERLRRDTLEHWVRAPADVGCLCVVTANCRGLGLDPLEGLVHHRVPGLRGALTSSPHRRRAPGSLPPGSLACPYRCVPAPSSQTGALSPCCTPGCSTAPACGCTPRSTTSASPQSPPEGWCWRPPPCTFPRPCPRRGTGPSSGMPKGGFGKPRRLSDYSEPPGLRPVPHRCRYTWPRRGCVVQPGILVVHPLGHPSRCPITQSPPGYARCRTGADIPGHAPPTTTPNCPTWTPPNRPSRTPRPPAFPIPPPIRPP